MALTLMVKAFKLNYSTPTNKNQRILSYPRNRRIDQLGMNMGQDRQMQMVGEVYVCQPQGFEDPDYPDKDLCKSFEKLMKDKFQMSSMRELTFFLGLQVKQKKDGIFISQDKYVADILRKFRLIDRKSASIPIDTKKPLLKDPDGEDVDVHTFRSMIGSLMYLTSSRPDIMFAICACAHFQVTLKASHLHAVKRIFRYLKVKKVNDVTRLQVPVDKKNVVVTEATIRDILRLDDAEGVECLPNKEIFAKLTRMGYEKPSTKLMFYKAFFLSQWKFLIHTILQCKGFSGVKTPLFKGMVVAQEVDVGVADEMHAEGVPAVGIVAEGDVSAANDELKRRVKKLERRNKVKVLKLRRLQKVGTAQRINTSDDTVMDDVSNQERMIADMDVDADVVLEEGKEVDDDAKTDQDSEVNENVDIQGRTAESQAKIYKSDLDHANKVLSMQEEESEPAEFTTITAADVPIPAATTVTGLKLTAAPSRRTKGVVIRDPEESTTTSTIIHSKAKSKDKGKGILVEEPKPLKKQAQIEQDEKYATEYQAMKRKPQTEAQARKNMMVYLKNVVGFKMDYFKEKAAKRKKLNEDVEELKKHLHIVPNEDDDVYTEATPLARKIPVVDYEIYNPNNKPYHKIIRADGTHQLYISFLSLLRNFDREDLEALWGLVKERFTTAKPKNFCDDFWLMTLGATFEKPDIHAQILKNQRSVHGQAKVKS
nr:uncharacterized mitochondrial protein AtMg00810-like [Tanacetum cinerariifolium]